MYSLIIALAFITGNVLFAFVFLKEKESKLALVAYMILNILSGLLTGTVVHTVMSGFTAFGGLSSIGGAIGIFISYLLCSNIFPNTKKTATKCMCLAIPLMYGIAKLACVYGGCCRGRSIHGKVFPIQITESIVFLIIFVYEFILLKEPSIKNEVTAIEISCVMKFMLDFLRERESVITNNQVMCLMLFIVVLVVYKFKSDTGKKNNLNDKDLSG